MWVDAVLISIEEAAVVEVCTACTGLILLSPLAKDQTLRNCASPRPLRHSPPEVKRDTHSQRWAKRQKSKGGVNPSSIPARIGIDGPSSVSSLPRIHLIMVCRDLDHC